MIVEQINADGSILISESNYGYSGALAWRTKVLNNTYSYGSLHFQGFIYIPLEFDTDEKTADVTFRTGAIYTTQYMLAVRTGAGTNFAKKTKKQLTKNAQANATAGGALKKGTKVTCQGVQKDSKGNIWIKIPSGYVAAYYNGEYYIK